MNPIERAFNVFYGYISFAIPIFTGICALISRGTRELLFISSIVVSVCVTEYGLKNIILEPKPEGACAITCGMPSGHACTTIQYYALLMIDYAFRLKSADPDEEIRSGDRACGVRIFKLMSNSNVDAISLHEFFALGLVWGFLLVPVPFSRVMNLDHTVPQVLIGSILGLACALATFGIYCILGRSLCRSDWQWPHKRNWYVLKNTIVLSSSARKAKSTQSQVSKVEEGLKDSVVPAEGASTQVVESDLQDGPSDDPQSLPQDVIEV
jgi:hypothetical protein